LKREIEQGEGSSGKEMAQLGGIGYQKIENTGINRWAYSIAICPQL